MFPTDTRLRPRLRERSACRDPAPARAQGQAGGQALGPDVVLAGGRARRARAPRPAHTRRRSSGCCPVRCWLSSRGRMAGRSGCGSHGSRGRSSPSPRRAWSSCRPARTSRAARTRGGSPTCRRRSWPAWTWCSTAASSPASPSTVVDLTAYEDGRWSVLRRRRPGSGGAGGTARQLTRKDLSQVRRDRVGSSCSCRQVIRTSRQPRALSIRSRARSRSKAAAVP